MSLFRVQYFNLAGIQSGVVSISLPEGCRDLTSGSISQLLSAFLYSLDVVSLFGRFFFLLNNNTEF